MKKTILFTLLTLSMFFVNAQNIKTDRFEVYLNDYMTSEVNISKGMYMTQNKQFFYEGKIEVNYIDSNTSKDVQFYFSTWDSKFKEFYVRDLSYQEISPRFSFVDNKTIKFTDANGNVITKALTDNSNVEYAILSSALVWLNSYNEVVLVDKKPVKDAAFGKAKESDVLLGRKSPITDTKEVVEELKEELKKPENEKDTFEKKLALKKKEQKKNTSVIIEPTEVNPTEVKPKLKKVKEDNSTDDEK